MLPFPYHVCALFIFYPTFHFLGFFFSIYDTSHKVQHTAVGPCPSYDHPRQTEFTWGYSRWLTYLISGHASGSFCWDFISATLDSDIVFSGGHALWKATKFYRYLYHSLLSSWHASESFRWPFISATLNSDIVFSGGHALWKFYRYLFHSRISSGRQA